MEYLKFVCWMMRPRAVRWWWRLGSFECICWSFDYALIEAASSREQLP